MNSSFVRAGPQAATENIFAGINLPRIPRASSPGELLPLLQHRARCLKNEPGTLQFEVLAPHGDDTKLLLYEVYQSDTAFDIHRNGPSIARFRKETAEMVMQINMTRCAVVARAIDD